MSPMFLIFIVSGVILVLCGYIVGRAERKIKSIVDEEAPRSMLCRCGHTRPEHHLSIDRCTFGICRCRHFDPPFPEIQRQAGRR